MKFFSELSKHMSGIVWAHAARLEGIDVHMYDRATVYAHTLTPHAVDILQGLFDAEAIRSVAVVDLDYYCCPEAVDALDDMHARFGNKCVYDCTELVWRDPPPGLVSDDDDNTRLVLCDNYV